MARGFVGGAIVCCALFGCLLGTIALIVSLVHTSDHPGNDKQVYCVAVRNEGGFQNLVNGRLGVDNDDKIVCVDMFYHHDPVCNLTSVTLKGPLNAEDGFMSSNTIIEIAGATEGNNGTIGPDEDGVGQCYRISREHLVGLSKNPALYYVEATYSGGAAKCGKIHRDYLTSLCQHPEFEISDIGSDDDDDDNEDDDGLQDDDDDNPGSYETFLTHAKVSGHKAAVHYSKAHRKHH